jgi:hypothetical protein
MAETDSIYVDVHGGPDLIAWFGGEPRFHDAEVATLNLRRRSESTLNVHFWTATAEVDGRGCYVLDHHVIVTFAIEEICDLEIEGFNHQNVIYGLRLFRGREIDPDRKLYTLGTLPNDYEIELDDCFGMSGRIRCKKLSIRLTPGKPEDSYL